MESSDVALLLGNLLARFLQAFWHIVLAVVEGIEVSTICGTLFLSEKFRGLSVQCPPALVEAGKAALAFRCLTSNLEDNCLREDSHGLGRFIFLQSLQNNNLPNYEYKRTHRLFWEEAFVFSILPRIIDSGAALAATRPLFLGP